MLTDIAINTIVLWFCQWNCQASFQELLLEKSIYYKSVYHQNNFKAVMLRFKSGSSLCHVSFGADTLAPAPDHQAVHFLSAQPHVNKAFEQWPNVAWGQTAVQFPLHKAFGLGRGKNTAFGVELQVIPRQAWKDSRSFNVNWLTRLPFRALWNWGKSALSCDKLSCGVS